MKCRVVTISAFLVLIGMCGFASAYIIDYDNYTEDGNEFTSSFSGALVETFEGDLNFDWDGDYLVVSGSSGQYAAPYGVSAADASKYISVPNLIANGAATASLGAFYNYFGLWWGSVDSYNSLEFYNGTTLLETIIGSDLITPVPANGNQTLPTNNLYVNFYDLPSFDSFKMVSTNYAFEADNIAVGVAPVPEPSTVLLLGCGLIGLAWFSRKQRKA